ncbi:MAG: CRTAC1 family protein, partial [Flavobacteriaceae bacterium]|nr:CRTAC1 family protein [Muriicola sp.]NNL40408.1 CRTAC1 family protein [Flavobacteriaceae bacterium]
MKRILRYTVLLSIVFSGCQKSHNKRFEKLSASRTGIQFSNTLTETPELNILNYLYFYNGAGVAAADFNNDNLVDLYFTSNQEADRLYLNQGNFNFLDITEAAGIDNSGNWTTGVTHADVNNDGLLDIYVCKVGKFRNIRGKNLLFVNQGPNKDGIPTFKEDAASYGLDFSGFSTQAAFLDYDLDGDLDMFLLNHSVHPNMTYGKGAQRLQSDPTSGDLLFRNDNGLFHDISEEAGIYQGRIGYGLGIGISDLNKDGYPDIYIGNDFFENDYLYINQKDGTFKEIISEDDMAIGHTTHFSMGNDLADINNDGLTDIISLDMLPEDLETYKTSGLEYPFPSYQYYLKNGYAPQYMQNTLHLNLGNESFSEIGQLAGISATEWSWSVLLADYDNDGHKDAFISNGIKRATNDMDFINFISNEAIQKRLATGMSLEDMAFIEEIPQKKTSNYFLKNTGRLSFEDVTSSWHEKTPTFSNGAVYADLDNDGDLDVVVNNVDEEALILNNLSSGNPNTNFLKISLHGGPKNTFGVGARVMVYAGGSEQLQEQFVSRGFLSAVPPELHFGLGDVNKIDSVKVIWPNGMSQVLPSPDINTRISLSEAEAKDSVRVHYRKDAWEVRLTATQSEIPFRHKEPATLEFDRDPMVPFANTNEGPEISVADVNNDGRED